MRTTFALVLLACFAFSINAQDKRVDIKAYGESNLDVAADTCEALGLRVRWSGVDAEQADSACWARIDGVSKIEATLVLSEVVGFPAVLDDGTGILVFYDPEQAAPGATVKGYDVSIAAGRFVSYVNTYGGVKQPLLEGEEPARDRTAAEHLAWMLKDLLYRERGPSYWASVVGEKLLFTLVAQGHAAVREVLDLLIAEGGGESATLKADRVLIEKLKSKKVSVQAEETPLASLFSDICAQAGVGMVLGYALAAQAGNEHANLDLKDVSAWDALQIVADMAGDLGAPVAVSALAGAARIEFSDAEPASYRVFDVSELLRKLDQAYARQRTGPGLADGSEGSLVAEGGVDVVVDAINEQLEQLGRADAVMVYSYGDRVIVRGSVASIDAAVTILKEMGWEE